MTDDWDLVSKLSPEDRAVRSFQLNCFSPDDGKYGKSAAKLVDFLTPRAEWLGFVQVQRALLDTRVEFGQALPDELRVLDEAISKFDPLNAALLEEDKRLMHDQLAVLKELERHLPPTVAALLHPGTTSYDIVDTARAYLLKQAWSSVIRPEVAKTLTKLAEIAEKGLDILQVGRTHLQQTSPVLFGGFIAGYAARLANRVERLDSYFDDLRGTISGIVGTGASIEMVIGEGKSVEFERRVLARLNLKPDYTATQVTQKERFADIGHGLVTLDAVLGDFANDIRLLYSSEIKEVSSRDNAERLGGSSADAGKDNPIQYENIGGKVAVIESGMRVLYEMIHSDLQRDLRSSVQGRYQPQGMMVEVLETFSRVNKALTQLSVNEDRLKRNLNHVRNNPSEAMTAILRGEQGWAHSKYGLGHDFVKEMAKRTKKTGNNLLIEAMEDPEFAALYETLSDTKKSILGGELELYTGSAKERAVRNITYARAIATPIPNPYK